MCGGTPTISDQPNDRTFWFKRTSMRQQNQTSIVTENTDYSDLLLMHTEK